jgi:hypothetical protein
MNNDDKFLYDYRKDPSPEAVEALWQKLSAQEQSRLTSRIGFYPKLAMVGLALILVLFMGVPPIRAVAQEIVQFFVQAAQDTFSINFTFDDPVDPQIDFVDIAPPPDVDVDLLVDEAPGANNTNPDFVYSNLLEARQQANLPIKAPVTLPQGYRLSRVVARRDSSLVTLVYRTDGSRLLTLHQQHVTSEKPTTHIEIFILSEERSDNLYHTNLQIDIAFGEVGPDVSIEPVQVGSVQGEYARGGWETDPNSLTNKAVSPDTALSVTPVWNSNSAGQMLRWQTDNTFFEIIASDESLSLPDLITVATSIE